jgi:hypothetical protein
MPAMLAEGVGIDELLYVRRRRHISLCRFPFPFFFFDSRRCLVLLLFREKKLYAVVMSLFPLFK